MILPTDLAQIMTQMNPATARERAAMQRYLRQKRDGMLAESGVLSPEVCAQIDELFEQAST